MRYLVLWSGGADSTELVRSLLTNGHTVTTGYVSIGNNEEKSQREKAARELIKERYFSLYSTYIDWGEIASISLEHGNRHLSLTQPALFLTSALWAADVDTFDYVAMAYVLKDDAVSYLEDFKAIWSSYKSLTTSGNLPELVFPLSKTGKAQIYESLGPLTSLITWCEGVDHKFDPCGACGPCNRVMNEVPDVFRSRIEIVHENLLRSRTSS
jgi:7-cyano-7-deazaguanine synthase in queuosine biosynthesis